LSTGVVTSAQSTSVLPSKRIQPTSSPAQILDVADDEDECLHVAKKAAKPPTFKCPVCTAGKKHSYTQDTYRKVIEILENNFGGNQTQCASWLATQTAVGWQCIDRPQLSKWKSLVLKEREKPGRKVNLDFEKDVLSRLLFAVMDDIKDKGHARVIANVAYSYAIIREAGRDAAASQRWKGDADIAKRKFADQWVFNFLERMRLSFKKVTAVDKKRPSDDEVRAIMKAIQQQITEGSYTLDEIHSADETGVFYAVGPKGQAVPEGADRASAAGADSKVRFTVMMSGSASGKMMPPFTIIKCSVKGYDLSSTTVIQSLHHQLGFRAVDGWSLRQWSRTLTLTDKKGAALTAVCKRPYLLYVGHQHPHWRGAVITCQHRAWMDTPGLAMYMDTLVQPWKERTGLRVLFIWDNCGPHGTAAVLQAMQSLGIAEAKLPKNMTDILQVMDLVVNGPLKAGVRRAIVEEFYDHFQAFRIQALKAEKEGRQRPNYEPPPITLQQGLMAVMDVFDTRFQDDDFQSGMKRCFVKVGLAPTDDMGFVNYTGPKKGVLPAAFVAADTGVDDAFVLGDAVAQATFEPPDEEDEFDDDEEEKVLLPAALLGRAAQGGGLRLQGIDYGNGSDKDEQEDEEEDEEQQAPPAVMKPAGPPFPEPPPGQCSCCDYEAGSARKPTAPGWAKHWSTSKGWHVFFLEKDHSVMLDNRPTAR
jgi:hypothetical protein